MIPEATASSPPATGRLLFVDNLRWLMIVLVVTMHAAVTYSGLGSWYYIEPTQLIALSLAIRGLALAPLLKFLLLSGVSLVVCFLASHYAFRRIPGLRQIL